MSFATRIRRNENGLDVCKSRIDVNLVFIANALATEALMIERKLMTSK
jgi:hypothetical protein